MEPSPSPECVPELTGADVDVLVELADLGVREGLAGRAAPVVDPASLDPSVREPRGVFVTLEVAGELNGCIGTVDPVDPLGVAVARLAWAAAFADPRLSPLTAVDYPSLEIKLSLIGPLEPVPAETETELAANLRPGVDGVLIRYGTANATFLPAVWQKVPDPLSFLRHLEAKAGLRPGQWCHGMQAWRYTTSDHRRKAVDIDRRTAA